VARVTAIAQTGAGLQPALQRYTFPVGPLACNCSVISLPKTGEALVIDPGADVTQLLEFLSARHLRLTSILVTHAHLDHIGAAAELKLATGAAVLLHARDLDLYSNLEWQARWMGVPTPERAAIDSDLSEAEVVQTAGLKLQVLETPGHTPGSVCLWMPDQELLFAGDTLFAGSIGRTDLPGGSLKQIMGSLQGTILALPDATHVVPGHGAETTIGRERQFNPFLQP